MHIGGKTYTRREVEKRVGSLRQLGGIRHTELADGRARGVRAAEFDTGSGLAFTVLPDRGLDVAEFSCKGTSLVYLTPSGIAHPAYYNPAGFEWLRTFFGGLLTTCGLTYFGDPVRDGAEELGLHGRYAGLPAARVCDLSRWEGDEYILEITGVVEECALFGDKLRLTRSLSTAIGAKSLRIRDRVENFGSRTSPFTILYHVNAGFPLLSEASELLIAPSSVEPYDEPSRAALPAMKSFAAPSRGAVGEDFLHTMTADSRGYARAAMVNRGLAGGLGLFLKFHTSTLPFLNEWKYLSEVDYVVGVEPVNTKIVGRPTLRSEGRLPVIEPGEIREMDLEIGALEGEEEISLFAAEVGRRAGSLK
jgi:hypothetical protein